MVMVRISSPTWTGSPIYLLAGERLAHYPTRTSSVAAPEPGKKLGNPGSRVTPVPIPSVRVLGVRPFGWIVVCLRRARSETNTVLHE